MEEFRAGEERRHITLPAAAIEPYAIAFATLIVQSSAAGPHSHFLTHFVRVVGGIGLDNDTLGVVLRHIAEISGRSLRYVQWLVSSASEESESPFSAAYPTGVRRVHHEIEDRISAFLICNSRLKGNYRVMDAHVGIDLAASFVEWLQREDNELALSARNYTHVTERHIEKIRRRIHVRRCAHDYFDMYTCQLCRSGVQEEAQAQYENDPNCAIKAAHLHKILLHKMLVKQQMQYYYQRLRSLGDDEAIVIIDHSKEVTAMDRCPLCVLVIITKHAQSSNAKPKYVYDHAIYGTATGMAGNWRFAQIALQDYLRLSACRYRRLDIFHDSYYGDFRNANMLLFYSIAAHVFGTDDLDHCVSSGFNVNLQEFT